MRIHFLSTALSVTLNDSRVLRVCRNRHGTEFQRFAMDRARDCNPIARQRLTVCDAAQIDGEVADTGLAAGLAMEVREIKPPAVDLRAPMLAG